MYRYIPKNKNLLFFARQLRREMTPQEKHLWYDFLRNYPVKIYKQRIIGDYIADFYCSKAYLVIELDGSQHYSAEGEEYDVIRNEYMYSLGLSVIRISNADINNNFKGVCEYIDQQIKEKLGAR